MTIRKRMLSTGWYPDTAAEVRTAIAAWKTPDIKNGRAGMVPHAGWYFSGSLAWKVISSLAGADTVIIMGGHLSPGDRCRFCDCDAFATPLGLIPADRELIDLISREIPLRSDDSADNTVEIQLPLVKYAFPSCRAVGLRIPPSKTAVEMGHLLSRLVKEEKLSLAVLGSTDLTHYGPNYGFHPRGFGPESVLWVERENDGPFLEAVVGMDPGKIIEFGLKKNAACSAGAAAAAAVFASDLVLEGRLMKYSTSLEKHSSTSFVGYGAVLFS